MKACETLWEFVEAAAPLVGLELTPHLRTICDRVDRACATAEHVAVDAASFIEIDKAEVALRTWAQDTLSPRELAEVDRNPTPDMLAMRDVLKDRRAFRALRQAAIAYASAKLREAGEAQTGSARLLLAQIAEDLE